MKSFCLCCYEKRAIWLHGQRRCSSCVASPHHCRRLSSASRMMRHLIMCGSDTFTVLSKLSERPTGKGYMRLSGTSLWRYMRLRPKWDCRTVFGRRSHGLRLALDWNLESFNVKFHISTNEKSILHFLFLLDYSATYRAKRSPCLSPMCAAI